MKTFRIMLLVLLLAGLFACNGSSSAPAAAPPKDAAAKSAIEERLVTELSPSADRAGRQRNDIINRAIDQNYDVYAAPEGYFYEILTPGDFANLEEGDIVSVHYRGNFLDGREFDNSRKRKAPFRFRVGDMISAWNLGLQQAKPGGSIRIITPSELAYGAEGLVSSRGDTLVPAHTILEFVIDNIEIHEEL